MRALHDQPRRGSADNGGDIVHRNDLFLAARVIAVYVLVYVLVYAVVVVLVVKF